MAVIKIWVVEEGEKYSFKKKKKRSTAIDHTAHASRAVGVIFWKGLYHKGKKENGTEFLAQEY